MKKKNIKYIIMMIMIFYLRGDELDEGSVLVGIGVATAIMGVMERYANSH